MNNLGEILALATAVCWTATSMLFAEAGKRIGSLNLNLIRLVVAFFYFVLFLGITGAPILPIGYSPEVWLTLGASGLIGFVFGDLFLFRSFVLIGPRLAMLVFSSVPVITVVLGLLFLGESISATRLAGIGLTLIGIAIVVQFRKKAPAASVGATGSAAAASTDSPDLSEGPTAPSTPGQKDLVLGVVFAFLAALGQAGGLVAARFGAGTEVSPFAGTQIRVIAGILGFLGIFVFTRRFHSLSRALANRSAAGYVLLGALFGPFLGVSLGLWSSQLTETGIAATLMSIVPVLIIIPSIVVYKEKITVLEVLGTIVTISGVAVLL